MRKRSSWMLILMGVLLALFAAPSTFAQTGMAKVRVVHASPDAPAVDVLVNGKAALTNVKFFTASDYLELPAGSYELAVVPTGKTEPKVIDAKGVKIEAGKAYTVAATGLLANIKATILADDLTPPAAGKAHVRIIHFSPDAPAVDVKVANGPTLVSNLAFPSASKYIPVDAGSYDVQVVPTGASTPVVINAKGLKLEAGKIYDVFATGALASIKSEIAVTTPASAMAPAAPAPAPGTLPRTAGAELPSSLLLVLAAALVGAGLLMRRRSA